MVPYTYDEAITHVLDHEGGYTNDPQDPGGPTNWGITIEDARKYWKPDATAADVRALPKSAAKLIYREHYAPPVRYDDLPAGLDYAVFDYGINSGTGRAVNVLRALCGMPKGPMTPAVLEQVKMRGVVPLIQQLNAERLRFLQSLRIWPRFGGGWGRRVSEVNSIALQMTTMPMTAGSRTVKPTIPAPGEVIAKGTVPAHAVTKHVGKVATGGAVATGGLWHWIGAHPSASIAMAIVAASLVAIIAGWLHHVRAVRQETPMPVNPVPAVKG